MSRRDPRRSGTPPLARAVLRASYLLTRTAAEAAPGRAPSSKEPLMNIVERSKDILLEVGAAPILYLMLVLSVMSIAVMIERAWFFFASSEDLGSLARAL